MYDELKLSLNRISLGFTTDKIDEKNGRWITVHPNGSSKGRVVHVDVDDNIDSDGHLSDALKAKNGKPSHGRIHVSNLLEGGSNKVLSSTSLSFLKFGKTKNKDAVAQHRAAREAGNLQVARNLALALAEDPETRDAGEYLMAKYHKSDEAAKNVVLRCHKEDTLNEIVSLIDPSKPVVFVPLQNKEGEGNNRLPFCYAKYLSGSIPGSTVCASVSKVSAEHNTGASASDRLTRKFRFDGIPDFKEGTQVFIVDDTWTSGQTCVSMANYIKSKSPNCEIKGITTLATSRYGSEVVPSEEKISKVLTKAGLSSEKEFSDLTGEDIRSKTGTELQMYIISGKKGRDGLTERFGKK